MGFVKLHVGQIVAYRTYDGKWEYDKIDSIRPAAEKEWNESVWLDRNVGISRLGTCVRMILRSAFKNYEIPGVPGKNKTSSATVARGYRHH
jgi:hypothetical protein